MRTRVPLVEGQTVAASEVVAHRAGVAHRSIDNAVLFFARFRVPSWLLPLLYGSAAFGLASLTNLTMEGGLMRMLVAWLIDIPANVLVEAGNRAKGRMEVLKHR